MKKNNNRLRVKCQRGNMSNIILSTPFLESLILLLSAKIRGLRATQGIYQPKTHPESHGPRPPFDPPGWVASDPSCAMSEELGGEVVSQTLTQCTKLIGIHPGRFTWNIIIEVWKIIFLSSWVICMFHVNLPGCTKKTASHLCLLPSLFSQQSNHCPPKSTGL